MAKNIKDFQYNPRIGRALSNASRGKADRYHIISREGEWIIKKDGNVKPKKIYSSRYSAIRYAQSALMQGKVREYVVHKKDGSIQEIKTRR